MSKLREKRKAFINLTINEIILLILFLLLLLTTKLMNEKDKLSSEMDTLSELFHKNDINEIRMQELAKIDKAIAELKEGNGEFADTEIPDIFNKLILAKDKYKKIKDKDTEIAKLADELELAEENLKEIEKNLKESKKNLKDTSQLKDFYKEKYEVTGADFPPCWPREDDPTNAEYIYRADITFKGIRLSNTDWKYPHRVEERKKLPLYEIQENKDLTDSEFIRQTKRIDGLARKNNCRHSLIIYDDSGNDKKHYKKMMKAIENHFYKFITLTRKKNLL